MREDHRKAHTDDPALDPKQLADVVKLLGGYGDADELRDLKQSVMACRTLDDLFTVQATIRALKSAPRETEGRTVRRVTVEHHWSEVDGELEHTTTQTAAAPRETEGREITEEDVAKAIEAFWANIEEVRVTGALAGIENGIRAALQSQERTS